MQIKKIIEDYLELQAEASKAAYEGKYKINQKLSKNALRILKKIVSFGEAGRIELANKMNEKDPEKASYAALMSLDFKENEAKKVLERISKEESGMLAFEAGQAIQRWNEKPWSIEDWFE